MESLARLQSRIHQLGELRGLFRALRALAASHLQDAQTALTGMRSYAEVVEDAIARSLDLPAVADITLRSPNVGHADGMLIVICSEHGFAGAFNDRQLDFAIANRRDSERLMIVGQRGMTLAAERELDVARDFPMATHVGGVLGITRRMADALADASTVRVVFAAYRRGGESEPEMRQILPIDPNVVAKSSSRSRPLHHLPPAALLDCLAEEYLFAQITRAVLETLASENGARLRAMESADHNIEDKLDGLSREENTQRQEAITNELLDLATGSEAILHKAEI